MSPALCILHADASHGYSSRTRLSPSQLQSTEGKFRSMRPENGRTPDDNGRLRLTPEVARLLTIIILSDEEKLDDRAKMSVAAKRSLFRVHFHLTRIQTQTVTQSGDHNVTMCSSRNWRGHQREQFPNHAREMLQ